MSRRDSALLTVCFSIRKVPVIRQVPQGLNCFAVLTGSGHIPRTAPAACPGLFNFKPFGLTDKNETDNFIFILRTT
jgi:hypothetical protein